MIVCEGYIWDEACHTVLASTVVLREKDGRYTAFVSKPRTARTHSGFVFSTRKEAVEFLDREAEKLRLARLASVGVFRPIANPYARCSKKSITNTRNLLWRFRSFLRGESSRMIDDTTGWRVELSKAEAADRLKFLIHTAINRKAGIPDERGHKYSSDFQRSLYSDRRTLIDWQQSRIRPSSSRFQTPYIQRRLGHLLPERERF